MKARIPGSDFRRWRTVAAGCTLAFGALLTACGGGGGGGAYSPSVAVLSSRPDYVSAGDALLKVRDVPPDSTLTLKVNGTTQPASFARYCAFDEQEDPRSVFATYAAAVKARKTYFASDEPLRWVEAPPGVLAFRRGGVACVVNVSDEEVESPVSGTVVLSSIPTPAGRIAPDAAVYVELE